jgi:PAS domain S-box-containing protein
VARDGAGEGGIGKDLGGLIWNRAAEVMFGYAVNEVVGQPIPLIAPPDRLDEETFIRGRIADGEKSTTSKRKGRPRVER